MIYRCSWYSCTQLIKQDSLIRHVIISKKFLTILLVNMMLYQKNKRVVLSGVEPESQVPETRMIAITP